MAQINVQEGELKLRVQGDEVTFHLFQSIKHPDDDPNEDILELNHKDILQGDLVNFQDKSIAPQKDTKRFKGMEAKIFHSP